ncbi:MAG: phosphate ABC transporter permease PstA [Planctomycetota bacterium]|nr:phosphate ABC transporter permease PstA [Planctomycetota bacterium]
MRIFVRTIFDKTFTVTTYLVVLMIIALLVIILGPMLSRGLSAVIFKDTIEFRKMQFALFNRGVESRILQETKETNAFRQKIYQTIDKFKQGIDTEALTEKARKIYREFGQQLRYKELPPEQFTILRTQAKEIRDKLETAFASQDKSEIASCINNVLQYRDDQEFKDTATEGFFKLALEFKNSVEKTDLSKHYLYVKSLQELESLIIELLGPRPDEPLPSTAMNQFGSTRWDIAQRIRDKILWTEQWVEHKPNESLIKIKTLRAEQFAGTDIEPLFGYIKDNIEQILKPRAKFYWQYFIDDSTPGHYFGGVGPEILGTLLLTVISMLFAVPIGIIAAAYLTECSSENLIIKIIRMCINTLAGVPSIVFGLFGLSFFVLFFLPLLGFPSKPCILAASLTLAILTLPVMIRASEEAIRSVPETYKEASLALGAGKFKTFMKVTMPAALPGILTGIILSLSRVAGETAPVLFTGAVALGPMPSSIFHSTRTLSYGSYDMAVGDRIAMMVPHNQYGMVAVLVMLILCLNIMAIVVRSRMFRKLHGH